VKFTPTIIENMFLIDIEKREDHRGYFVRNFCISAFKAREIGFELVQSNFSVSKKRGTLRGLHYQTDGKEAKLVRCTRGAVYDIVLDLRPDSHSFLKSSVNEISDQDHRLLYIPPGCAHGFLTLAPDSEVSYFVSAPYSPELEKGVRYNDPLLKDIKWPIPIEVISAKDLGFPDYLT
jgi:dTDP-4-dehydrorhamnose 3,5-epimerase